jgi:hypothetical protein
LHILRILLMPFFFWRDTTKENSHLKFAIKTQALNLLIFNMLRAVFHFRLKAYQFDPFEMKTYSSGAVSEKNCKQLFALKLIAAVNFYANYGQSHSLR